jgi:hypothetical protein
MVGKALSVGFLSRNIAGVDGCKVCSGRGRVTEPTRFPWRKQVAKEIEL